MTPGRLDDVEALMLGLVVTDDDTTSTAARHHLEAGGRRVRARMALHAAAALRLQPSTAVALAAAVELLHNATLVHDDVQDGDRERRGRPSVWAVFGVDTAICVGDLMLSASTAALAGAGGGAGDLAPLLHRLHTRVGQLVRGQVADLAADGRVDLAAYEAIARGKSGTLLGLPLELPLLRAGHGEAVDQARLAGELFAIGYQAADDLGDVARDRRAGAPNIVPVLARAGSSTPADEAVRFARTHFVEAATCARRLPDGAGDLLADEAERAASDLAGTPGPTTTEVVR